jgi:hypothetical protein
MAKHKVTTLSEQLVLDLDALAKKIQVFLIEHSVKPKDSRLSSLIEALEDLNIIIPGVQYHHFTLDTKGYITDIGNFGNIVEKTEVLPVDVTRGYYKIQNGKIVLDEKQRQKLWEVS